MFRKQWSIIPAALIAAQALLASSLLTARSASAENCRSLPPGPYKASCVSRQSNAPEQLVDQCRQRAIQLGFTPGQPGNQGMPAVIQRCIASGGKF